MRARGGELMLETILPVELLIVRSDPGVGTSDDRSLVSIPRGFLKVALQLEKGMKFLYVLIAIIRCFKLSSKHMVCVGITTEQVPTS